MELLNKFVGQLVNRQEGLRVKCLGFIENNLRSISTQHMGYRQKPLIMLPVYQY
jgi:hypothetical protein